MSAIDVKDVSICFITGDVKDVGVKEFILKKIKGDYPKAKVVMITAAGQKTKMVEAVRNGAAEFITKPFEAEHLKSVFDNILNK